MDKPIRKPLEERTNAELKERHAELVAKMKTLTDRNKLIAHSNAILAVEDEMRRRKFAGE